MTKQVTTFILILLTGMFFWSCEGETTGPDEDAPDAPTGLTRSDLYSDGEVYISWNASLAKDVESYTIYRSETENAADYARIYSTEATSYLDVGLDYNTTYYYKVAKVIDGAEVCDSNEVEGTPRIRRRR